MGMRIAVLFLFFPQHNKKNSLHNIWFGDMCSYIFYYVTMNLCYIARDNVTQLIDKIIQHVKIEHIFFDQD